MNFNAKCIEVSRRKRYRGDSERLHPIAKHKGKEGLTRRGGLPQNQPVSKLDG